MIIKIGNGINKKYYYPATKKSIVPYGLKGRVELDKLIKHWARQNRILDGEIEITSINFDVRINK